MNDTTDEKVQALVAKHSPEELARAYLRASRRAAAAERKATEAKSALDLMKVFREATVVRK